MFAGGNFLHDYSGNAFPTAPVVGATFNDGWIIGGALGRTIGDRLRGEGEFAFRDNTGETWTVNGATGPYNGHTNVYTLMSNLLYDFNSIGRLTPYVGAGAGIAFIDSEATTNMTTITVDDEVFATQLIAGTTIAVNNRAELFAEYRWIEFQDVDVINAGTGARLGQDDFQAENVILGIRINR